ncbi:MAG: SBBP repeat-containing protein [Deltaproteobacteria bacterium]|nr:SBBP repeat-containing protein [Deltaproteobacteria bacterium]
MFRSLFLAVLFLSLYGCAESSSGGSCGNNVLDGVEECDGADFGLRSCMGYGYNAGTLICNDNCTVSVEGCYDVVCGDSYAEGDEECDRDDMAGESCATLGYEGGILKCEDNCVYDESSCTEYPLCGDDIISESEECELGDDGSIDCESLGYYSGTASCGENCLWDISLCERCGDNVIQSELEECDNDSLGTAQCLSLTGVDGTISCTSKCMYSYLNCNEVTQMGTNLDDTAVAMAVTSEGDLIITGTTEGSMDGEMSNGGSDIFVRKISSDGSHIWTVHLGGEGNEISGGVSIDSSGNIIITGYSDGAFNGMDNSGYEDILLASLDSNGGLNWGILHGTVVGDYGEKVAVDGENNIYVTGYTYGDLDSKTNNGEIDIFVMKFTTSGEHQWTTLIGTPENDYANSILVDSTGNSWISGYTAGDLDNTNSGGNDALIMKLNRSGIVLWMTQFGSFENDGANDIYVDASGIIWVTGYTAGDLYGNTTLGGYDAFISKHGSTGLLISIKQFGTPENDYGNTISGNENHIFVGSMSSGDTDIWTHQGNGDVMLNAFDTGLNQETEIRSMGTSSEDKITDSAIDSQGNVYLLGNTSSSLGDNWSGGSDVFLIHWAGKY